MIVLKDGKPFEGEVNLSADRVSEVVALGLWDDKELADRGLVLCEPFVAPEGMIAVGEPRYVEGKDGWVQEYDVEVAPVRVPPTRAEKFFMVTGFTIEELKEMLK